MLQVLCKSAIKRDKPIEHTILLASPGMGKTTMAKLLAKERGVGLIETIGSALATPDDLTRLLLRLKTNWVLAIDEAHRMPPAVEEQLYPALEDLRVASASGGQSSAFMRSLGIAPAQEQATMVDVAPFTLVLCSTLSGMISAPLRSRCQVIQLLPYTTAELRQIVLNACGRVGFEITVEAAEEVARRSRSAGRNAIQNLKWLIEFCTAEDASPSPSVVEAAFDLRQIDRLGLTTLDHEYLAILRGSRGPVGLQTVAVRLGESEDTLERTVEPYLLQKGFVERTAKGRILGPAAGEAMKAAA
jgi:Holliday junction DNA helicase RuvB